MFVFFDVLIEISCGELDFTGLQIFKNREFLLLIVLIEIFGDILV